MKKKIHQESRLEIQKSKESRGKKESRFEIQDERGKEKDAQNFSPCYLPKKDTHHEGMCPLPPSLPGSKKTGKNTRDPPRFDRKERVKLVSSEKAPFF